MTRAPRTWSTLFFYRYWTVFSFFFNKKNKKKIFVLQYFFFLSNLLGFLCAVAEERITHTRITQTTPPRGSTTWSIEPLSMTEHSSQVLNSYFSNAISPILYILSPDGWMCGSSTNLLLKHRTFTFPIDDTPSPPHLAKRFIFINNTRLSWDKQYFFFFTS